MKQTSCCNSSLWTEQLLAAMMKADRREASEVIRRAKAEGIASDLIIAEILDPALFKLGHLWGKETVSLAQTFVAAKIAEDVLLLCVPGPGASASHNTPVVIGNIEDDFHSLGRRPRPWK